ncbi:MAG TPA: hypothetical protein VH054_10485 [Polyangiaceae bacterium]|jgi:hypothetical protein|nr:hypothetical protein [Polyangiaceae bacterium]
MNAKVVAFAALALGSSAAALACVLADPPPIVTPAPQQAPEILTLSVTPPPSQVLKTNPCDNVLDCFVVPVLVDPNQAVKWRVFVDLDPNIPTQEPALRDQDDGGVLGVTTEAGPSIRTIQFSLQHNLQFDPTQCHTITFIVAYDFFDSVGDPSTPSPAGVGSSVTWYYQPLEDCTFYDAGALPDGGTD